MSRQPLPLPVQKEKLARVFADRAKLYQLSLCKGAITAAIAIEKEAELDDIANSFAFLVKHAHWIKPEAERRRIVAQQARDLADLEATDAEAAALVADARAIGATPRITSSGRRAADVSDDATQREDIDA